MRASSMPFIPGISPEQQSRLFHSFVQAETSTTRKYGGTGLGLVISKNIIEMMDGGIWVESELGKGATFSFTVCLARGKGEQKRLLDPGLNLENTRLLAVDDDPDVLAFFVETAKQLRVACDTAPGGHEAVAQIDRNGPYNIYFIDWAMPGMNGIELARIINEKNAGNSVIIMISATDWSVIQESAHEVGVTKFLPKPLFISSIADCINECLGMPSQAFAQTEFSKNFKGHRILLAEDVDINREIVLALLEPTNLEIDCAANGAEAVKAFEENPLKYDMIFMDVQMPEMDGYTATQTIRASQTERSKEIPIVAMTANVFKEDIEKCLEAGMNGHIGKPLDFDEVIETLEKYLRKES
jgi:CheY-like chemotaxis protein